MAGVSTESKLTAEIEQLKSHSRCKIMKNVGDFTYLIDATIPDTEVVIKFQLTAQYPQIAPGLFVRHPTMSKDDIQKVIASVPDSITNLLELFNFIKDQILPHQVVAGSTSRKQSSPPGARSKKKKGGQNTDKDTGCSKKPSMRTAADVIKRIQWDSSLEREAFIVGYIDRFLGIQEQPFTAFNWVNPAEADWMDLNIPEHRIEYFKYNGTIVWEKKSRIDNVFGSTGGTTIDQLLTQDQASTDNQDCVQPLSVYECEEGQEPTAFVGKTEKRNASIHNNIDSTSNSKEQTRDRPNSFIALPITDSHVVQIVEGIQDEYITLSESDGEEYKKELYNLHITLCAVRIDNQDDLDAVTEVLYELIVDRKFQQEFALGKLGSFWGRVLYASAELGEAFTSFVIQLRKSLANRGIPIYDDTNDFIPHLTIFNFPRSKSSNMHFPIDDFIAIKSDDNSNSLANVETALQEVVIYSMKRDENNRYIQHVTLDLHS